MLIREQYSGLMRIVEQLSLDICWTADLGLIVPRVSLAGSAKVGLSSNLRGITNGYLSNSSLLINSYISNTWTEIGVLYYSAAGTINIFSGCSSAGGQSLVFNTTVVDFHKWGVSTVNITGGAPPTGLISYVARNTPTGQKLWINGSLFGSGGDTSSIIAGAPYTSIGSLAGSYALSSTDFLMLVGRTSNFVSDNDCRKLSSELLSLLSENTARYIPAYQPADSILVPPYLSNPGVTNITTTGAQPLVRVDY